MAEYPHDIARRFGENLRRCRKRSRLSQEELAVLASVHRTEIGLLERGERIPRIDTWVKLAAGLSVPPDELIAGIAWQPGVMYRGGFELTADREAA